MYIAKRYHATMVMRMLKELLLFVGNTCNDPQFIVMLLNMYSIFHAAELQRTIPKVQIHNKDQQ